MCTDGIRLEQKVLALIRGEPGAASFEALALEVFAFQYEHCAPYRAYCDRLGCTPQTVTDWRAIPAVPTRAFKDFSLTCFPTDEAVAEFHTSGTTSGRPGRHFFRTLAVYDAAMVEPFRAALLEPAERPLPMLLLAPSPSEAPHSSLSYMLERLREKFGAPESEYFVVAGRLERERLVRRLCEAQWASQPVMLLGTAFAFVHLLDYCEQENLTFALPSGSRVMETGGYKGRSRELPVGELYRQLRARLGVTWLVNEYGMTELSSQFYSREGERKRASPWNRITVINPRTGSSAEDDQVGLIRVLDLANVWSVACIQTEDLGRGSSEGFEVLGRAANAEVRGCSLTAEAWQ
ncbi:MAG: long-chain fatty acid--CoA ligase [Verrucomicrobiae bacterium]|nr:long-chain fatty acid--CoA ligase [Verrucomicrobiae bacterium]